jgi:hypothetical protein
MNCETEKKARVERPPFVRRSLPPRKSEIYEDIPQVRVSIAMPLFLHIDCDASMTDEQIAALWRDVMIHKINYDAVGYGRNGPYQIRCNKPLSDMERVDAPRVQAAPAIRKKMKNPEDRMREGKLATAMLHY